MNGSNVIRDGRKEYIGQKLVQLPLFSHRLQKINFLKVEDDKGGTSKEERDKSREELCQFLKKTLCKETTFFLIN